MRKFSYTPALASLFVFIWMYCFFGDVFKSPNEHLFNEQGDGIKAFYVYADHIKNDTSYHQLQNMNYPYGQTHIFTDGQTAIANTVKFLSNYFYFFEKNCIGIYNYLILCSFILCAFFIGLLLKRFGTNPLITIAGSFCITVLSPQIMRISGHPTLSYAFFFPLSWYLLILFIDSDFKLSRLLLLIFNTTFWVFVHPYLGMAITLFYVGYVFVFLLQKNRKEFFRFKKLLLVFILICTPLILVKGYSLVYDHHEFRSVYPWGFWVFYSKFISVFLPHSPPLSLLVDYWGKTKTIDWNMETLAYVGIAVDFILLFTLFKFLKYLFKKSPSLILNPVLPKHLGTSLWASVLILLFSMCIPFKFGMQDSITNISFLMQFRSLGRFAWVFYYVAGVYSVFVFGLLFRFFRIRKMYSFSLILAIIFFALFVIESIADFKERAKWAILPKNIFNENYLSDDYKSMLREVYNIKNDYQCLVPLPFFHVGTENFGVEYSEKNIAANFMVSYWCNFPSMASSAARSPILEGKKTMQFFSPPFIKKEIEKDFPSKKDFLILNTKEPLNDNESALLKLSKKIYENNSYELWKLPFEAVFKSSTQEEWNNYTSIQSSLIKKDDFELTSDPDILIYKNFDQLSSSNRFQGAGALQVKKKDFTVLYEGANVLKADKEYTVSYWYYNKGELRNQVLCAVEECDKDGNNCKWEIIWDPKSSMTIDGDWTFVEKKFKIKDSSERIKVFIQGDEHSKQDIFIDEFLLRPADINVYRTFKSPNDSILYKNNLFIKKSF